MWELKGFLSVHPPIRAQKPGSKAPKPDRKGQIFRLLVCWLFRNIAMNSKDALLCHHGTCLDYTEGEMDGENFCGKIWPFFPKIGLINFGIITLDSKCCKNFEHSIM